MMNEAMEYVEKLAIVAVNSGRHELKLYVDKNTWAGVVQELRKRDQKLPESQHSDRYIMYSDRKMRLAPWNSDPDPAEKMSVDSVINTPVRAVVFLAAGGCEVTIINPYIK